MSDQQQQAIVDMNQEQRNNYYSRMALQVGDLSFKIKDLEANREHVLNAMDSFAKAAIANPVKVEPAKETVAEVVG